MNITSILLIAAVLIAIYVLSLFNRLKIFQVRIKASIQEIGNQLKRQSSLIPNLAESAKTYLKHEKDIYSMITSARKAIDDAAKSGNVAKLDQSQEMVNKILGSLRVIVESNPELKASGIIQNFMDELRDTADKLMYARRTVIDLSADYNSTISTIPGIWIAPLLGFKEEKGLDTALSGEHISVSSAELQDPKINLQ